MGKEETEVLERISKCIVDLDMKSMHSLVQKALDAGISPQEILKDGMSKGVDIAGQKYSSREYFLSELLAAGETMQAGMEVLAPLLEARGRVHRQSCSWDREGRSAQLGNARFSWIVVDT